MILGVGCDLLVTKRLSDLMHRRGADRLASRILSAAELQQWRTVSRLGEEPQLRFLALRWTAKEAAYKALYPRHVPGWGHLTVSKDSHKPEIVYEPEASGSKDADGKEGSPDYRHVYLHLTCSHDGGQTMAVVVAETDLPLPRRQPSTSKARPVPAWEKHHAPKPPKVAGEKPDTTPLTSSSWWKRWLSR